jgi:hypothetical protein
VITVLIPIVNWPALVYDEFSWCECADVPEITGGVCLGANFCPSLGKGAETKSTDIRKLTEIISKPTYCVLWVWL